MPDMNDIRNPVILFDGVCNLCSSTVQFIIKRDKKNRFLFASLQSEFGESLLRRFNLSTTNFKSFLLYKDGQLYTKSTGALMVVRHLSGAWGLLYSLILVPRFLRNAVYDFVAGNRYKWFGKKEACWVPSPALKAKFLN
jgi:predicted DCC family thiol-disulfide oxidoreductase YuxK